MSALALAVVASTQSTVQAANPPAVQKYYVPFPENDLLATFIKTWGSRPSNQYYPINPMSTVVTITVALPETIVYYDQWEDGYEADLSNPVQASTQIWGDSNVANGAPPGIPSDVIGAGDVIVLYNQLNSTTLQTVVDFDARDKIGASKGVAVVRSGWASQSNTLMAGAVEVFSTARWGTDYRAPVGQNTSIPWATQDDQFEYVAFVISAGEGGATVNIDADNSGSFETSGLVLAEGQSHLVDGGVQLGGHITADRPVQVILFASDIGSYFETRDSSLLPTTSLGSSYYTPVSTTDSVTWPNLNPPPDNLTYTPLTVVWLYNPGASTIAVKYVYRVGAGALSAVQSVNVNAGSYGKVTLLEDAAYHFYTEGSPAPTFYAWSSADGGTDQDHGNYTAERANETWDWGFSLLPENFLSPQVICGLGIGRDPTADLWPDENGNPVWVTPVGNGNTAARVYVDYNGDGGALTDPNGNGYDAHYDLLELQQQKLFDPDGDQTGMLVYVLTEGVKLSAAWGQDPLVAHPGEPGVDVGTSIPPLPVVDAAKTAALAVDTDADGQPGPGDTLEYQILVLNAFRGTVNGPFLIQDTLPADTAYIAGSTKYRFSTGGGTGWGPWVAIPDGGGGTLPLDGAGYSLAGSLPQNEKLEVVFRAAIDAYGDLEPGRTKIVNDGKVVHLGITIPITADTPLKGSLGDRVWNDVNSDGVQDGGELGINGVRVYVDTDGDGVYDAGEPSAITAGDGDYLITNLPAGNYTVRVDASTLPAGYGPTYDLDGIATPNVASPVALAAGQDRTDVDFGYRAGASLGDRVWLDRDGNGVQDAGEPGINGVRVYIDLDEDNTYDAGEPNELTAGDGNYTIGGLAAGTPYSVRVDTSTLPSGLTQTYDLTAPTNDHEATRTLAANENATDVDFGYQGAYSLGDLVWNDTDADGIKDVSESGISGVRVFIDVDGDGIFDANEPSATTSSSGLYTIGNLPAGTYTVRVDTSTLDPSFAQTYDLDGLATPHVATVTITNANRTDVDFGYRDRASLGDRVWNDVNSDGVQDPGEQGINGVRVYIDTTGNNSYDVGEPFAVTSGDGNYTIGDLASGTYAVRVDTTTLPGGATQTYDLNGGLDHEASVALSANQDRTDVDFGYNLPATASLGDRVWNDNDADGVQDAGETGINGVRVYIDSDNDGAYDVGEPSALTAGDGNYLISNLVAGSYVVRVDTSTLPAGANQTYDLNGALDHRADVTLLTGQARTDVDFGYLRFGALGNFVWLDEDADGIQDGTESGLDGVTVNLYRPGFGPDGQEGTADDADVVATEQTTGGGLYEFAGLVPGNYVVEFVPLAGYAFSPRDVDDGNSDPDERDSDAEVGTGLSTTVAVGPGQTDLRWDAGLFLPFIEITAHAYCLKDAPWVHYEVTTHGLTASLATIEWIGTSGVVETLTDQPLSGDILWPESAVDANGFGSAWPGWELQAGAWVEIPSTVRPQATLRITVNPTEEVVLTYPPATPNCACEPYVSFGNLVFKDEDNDGKFGVGDSGINGVTLELWSPGPNGAVGGGDDSPVDLDPDLPGVQNTVTTANGGFYLFHRVPSARYFVRIPPGEFATGEELFDLLSSNGSGADDVTDHPDDENGVDDPSPEVNGIVSSVLNVQATQAPEGDLEVGPLSGQADSSENLTLDFGFRARTPTVATLGSFRASAPTAGGVQLTWRTLVEHDLVGFHIERSTGSGGWERVTAELIPATGWNQQPQTYSFTDSGAPATNGLKYRLVEVSLRGLERIASETSAGAALTAAISWAPHGLGFNLELRGAPNANVTIETAGGLGGPWTRAQTLTLDGAGAGAVNVGLQVSDATRFYRAVSE